MGVTMAALLPTVKFNFLPKIPSSSNSSIKRVVGLKPVFCSAVQEVEQQESKVGILCEPCNGTGWLLCDFCNGQKTNVKSQTNKIYRRCPSCKAGLVLESLHDSTCLCLFMSTKDFTWTKDASARSYLL
ncbi:uncharacterized protein LOC110696285 isoform X2 [Chenopodium quinoa]|uniref:uncharacterized protein LOC110696285 isoform X2 n=1 Tax=Chenopodium quinoa TaxID=63459 RepID=UPI000B77B05D|nr:uncharacterized protein LOC110696285 isoform X2 [Chenopodium quinoa]